MNRIDEKLSQLKQAGKKALIPYVVAGDPTPDATLSILHGLVGQGADILELGVPFSDPMAEGPVIQLAHERALEHNVSLRNVLSIVAQFRETDETTPIVLMGYANPIEVMGYDAFAEASKTAGVDGLLLVDMPPEEAGELNASLKAKNIHSIYLIAPTTTDERAKRIIESASGYIYYVSLKGVTGAGHLQIDEVSTRLGSLSQMTDLPLCVGFGIKDPESAVQLAAVSSGVVVGSVLVNKIAQLSQKPAQEIAQQTAAIIGEMRVAIDAS